MIFAANISALWSELPFLDRFEAAADAGFKGVEVLFPYDTPVQEAVAALRRNDLSFVLLNTPPPNYTGGLRGYAAVPGSQGRFQYDLKRAARYAVALKAERIHIMAGRSHGAEAKETMLENLRHAVASVPKGLELTIEPICEESLDGYFLNDFDLAIELIEAVGAPNLGLQFDTYHAAAITGDVTGTFKRVQKYVRHIQIGDYPGRTAPGLGKTDFAQFFKAVEASGYKGWISAEYNSDDRTNETLNWRTAVAA